MLSRYDSLRPMGGELRTRAGLTFTKVSSHQRTGNPIQVLPRFLRSGRGGKKMAPRGSLSFATELLRRRGLWDIGFPWQLWGFLPSLSPLLRYQAGGYRQGVLRESPSWR